MLFLIILIIILNATTKTNCSKFQNQFTDMMWHQQIHEQMQRDAETARMASTGVEFGGFNCDPAMNPGMTDHGMF